MLGKCAESMNIRCQASLHEISLEKQNFTLLKIVWQLKRIGCNKQCLYWVFSFIEPVWRWNSYLLLPELLHIKDGLNMFPENIALSKRPIRLA